MPVKEQPAFILTPCISTQLEEDEQADEAFLIAEDRRKGSINAGYGDKRATSANSDVRTDRQENNRYSSRNSSRQGGSRNGSGMKRHAGNGDIRLRLTTSNPDQQHGMPEDDRIFDRRSCRSLSGCFSAPRSLRVSACNSAHRRTSFTAPGYDFCNKLDEDDLRYRLRQATAKSAKQKPKNHQLRKEEKQNKVEVEEEEYNVDLEKDDLQSERHSPELELSSKVYKKACNQLGIVPVSFFCRHLQNRDLIMRQHLIGPKGVRAISIALVFNTSVQKLDLTGNDIGNSGAHYIAQMLSENLFISTLILADNGLSSPGLKSLCRVLMNNTTIRKLDISGNHFTEADAVHIADLLKENTPLHEFYLRHNDFREAGGELIAAALVKNTSLVVLDLSWNHLRRKGAVSISEAMEKNESLQVLRVAWNGWYMEGCKALGRALASNQTLLELDLTCNRINKECLGALLTNLKNNTTLEKLIIDANPLTADGARLLMSTLIEAKDIAINFIDISSQVIDQGVLTTLEQLQEKRNIVLRHGLVLQHEEVAKEADSLLDEDPMMVLMEFMRQRNMRLVDLFQSLDTDGSKSLTRDEFRAGLLSVNIPMSAASFDRLMKKLDQDGDGEVDFSELMDGQKEYKRKLMRLQKKQATEPEEESDIQRIERKIKAIFEAKMAAEKEKKASEKLRATAVAVMMTQTAGAKLRAISGALTQQGGETQQ